MIATFDYDIHYSGPSMPVIEVTLKNPVTDGAVTVQRALVDSGADGTMVPVRLLRQIRARRVDTTNIRLMRGPAFRVDIYEVEIRIGSSECPRHTL
jgi:predicted aspartyl protease